MLINLHLKTLFCGSVLRDAAVQNFKKVRLVECKLQT